MSKWHTDKPCPRDGSEFLAWHGEIWGRKNACTVVRYAEGVGFVDLEERKLMEPMFWMEIPEGPK